jgi:hypothetical protein
MKYVKTFESFSAEYYMINEEEEFLKKIGEFLSKSWNKIKDKFVKWKDEKLKQIAQKILAKIEAKKNDPEVAKQLSEMKDAMNKFSDAEKGDLQKLQNEETVKKLGEELDKSGVAKEMVGEKANEALLLESLKDKLGMTLKVVGLGAGIAGLIFMGIKLAFMTGCGYVAIAGSMVSAGVFCAVMIGIIVAVVGILYAAGEALSPGGINFGNK